MRGTPLGRPKLGLRRVWRTRGLALLLGLMSAGLAHAEDVVIPFECDVRMGDVRLVPSEPRSYRIFGSRDRQIYSACDPQDPGQCKNYQIHRFDIDCGGTRVSWLKVAEAAARLDGERVSVKRNQMLLEVEPRGGQAAEPYPADGRWDPDRRNSGDPYGVAQGEAVVSFPPGFAPAIGLKPVFTGRDPAQVQQLPPAGGTTGAPGSGYGVPYDAAEAGGWDTQAKGWSQSPKGVPLDQEAQQGWDAEKATSSGPEGASKSAAKAAPVSTSAAASAGSKTPGASYGTETVTSQKLPEIGARPAKSPDAAKKTAASPATGEAAKAVQKKPAAKTVETAAKSEPPKQDAVKVEHPKSEPAKADSVKPENKRPAQAEVAKAEPQKDAAKSELPRSEPLKTETAMIEPPKPDVKAEAKPEAPKPDVTSEPSPMAAGPEQPQMLNGRDAASSGSSSPAKSVAAAPQPAPEPVAPIAAASPQPAAPVEPSPTSSALAPVPAAPTAPAPLASPDQATVVADAAAKTQDTMSIETSSISIVGQKVPLSSAWYLGAAALLTAAGFFFMMRRGQEVEAATYVERDITRVSLGAAGEGGARLSGPSFELPMPDVATLRTAAPEPAFYPTPVEPVHDVSMMVPEPPVNMAPVMMSALESNLPAMMDPRAQVVIPDMSLMSDIRSRMAPPVDEITLQVPVEMSSPDVAEEVSQPDLPSRDEPAPEAVELARAIAEVSDAIGEADDETRTV